MPPTIETYERKQRTDGCVLPVGERVLTEVDHLSAHRLPDGSYPDHVLDDLKTNLVTAVKEASIPFAISRTEREFADTPAGGKFLWLGKTAVESAESGYGFHFSEEAFKRVDIEVDEARYLEEELQPDVIKVFISPKMSEADAPGEIAKKEHLADDDALRINWLSTDENGNISGLKTESILVRDVPLQAWVDMLEDPTADNIFKKPIEVRDPDSALSVFEVHRQLVVDPGVLPEGCITLLEKVLPYIREKGAIDSVSEQIELFRGNQDYLDSVAEKKALEWLGFEHELSTSLEAGETSFGLRRFIAGLQHNWNDEALEVIKSHALGDTRYEMSRELAVVLENAKRNTLWAHTGIEVGDKRVLDQLDIRSKQEFTQLQAALDQAAFGSNDYLTRQAEMSRFLADSGVKTGGGCPGSAINMFGENGEIEFNPDNVFGGSGQMQAKSSERSKWRWKKGHCQNRRCPSRPNQTMVGPCDICVGCQAKFDNGEDPTR